MLNKDFSVLMSLYIKEKPEFFSACMDSMISQTRKPSQIVIVKDGPLTDALEDRLSAYISLYPDIYTIISLKENRGLGQALAEGIQHCNYELVARMDTDDVSRKDRFEKQLAEFEADPELDICGSHILEFDNDTARIVTRRKVPINDAEIKEYQKRRDAFNHVTVMYKKSSVLKAGNYQSCMFMEDTLLWVHMIQSECKCKNVDDYLVYVRIGQDMYERRGGLAYFKKYKSGRKKIYDTGYISGLDYYYTLLVQFIVCILPNHLRGMIFKELLHG